MADYGRVAGFDIIAAAGPAEGARVAGFDVVAAATPAEAAFISSFDVIVAMVGPLSDVPPLGRVAGFDVVAALPPIEAARISGFDLIVAMVGPLSSSIPTDIFEDMLPAMAARGQALAYFQRLFYPIYDLKTQVALLAASAADLELACEWMLDFWGDLEGEARNGLSDEEYRRLITVRRVAKYGRHSLPAIYNAFVKAVGVTATDINLIRLAPASVLAWATMPAPPSFIFLRQAGQALADVMPAGYQINASVALADTLFWDDGSGTLGEWGTEDWAYDFRST